MNDHRLIRVGARHGRPVVLKVDSEAMRSEGIVFYRFANGVWLVDRVPAKYLSLSTGLDCELNPDS